MYDISYPGIVQWNKMVFEKLGYMVLAFDHGHYDSTECYKNCIEQLIKAIEENNDTQDNSKDRLNDYSTMKKNLLVLLNHVEKDFKLNEEVTEEVTEEVIEQGNGRVNEVTEQYGGKKSSKKSSKKPSKKPSKKSSKKSSTKSSKK